MSHNELLALASGQAICRVMLPPAFRYFGLPEDNANIKACTKLIKEQPKNAAALKTRGDIYLSYVWEEDAKAADKKKWMQKAITDWTSAKKLAPDDASITFRLKQTDDIVTGDSRSRALLRMYEALSKEETTPPQFTPGPLPGIPDLSSIAAKAAPPPPAEPTGLAEASQVATLATPFSPAPLGGREHKVLPEPDAPSQVARPGGRFEPNGDGLANAGIELAAKKPKLQGSLPAGDDGAGIAPLPSAKPKPAGSTAAGNSAEILLTPNKPKPQGSLPAGSDGAGIILNPNAASLPAATPVPPPSAVAALPPAQPVTPAAASTMPAAPPLRRVALVIGNSAYKIGTLKNPRNDADAIARMLESDLHFDVVLLRPDLGVDSFRRALSEMAAATIGADVAVIFYAGHGTERDGKNYLIPTDASLARVSDLDLQSISLSIVLDQISAATRLKLVILDACRNNAFPLAGSRRTVTRGFAPIEPEDNTLIAYAAKAGATAEDGASDHSPFTLALLQHLKTPGIDVRFVMGSVRDHVMEATSRLQQPHIYGTLGGKEIVLSSVPAK